MSALSGFIYEFERVKYTEGVNVNLARYACGLPLEVSGNPYAFVGSIVQNGIVNGCCATDEFQRIFFKRNNQQESHEIVLSFSILLLSEGTSISDVCLSRYDECEGYERHMALFAKELSENKGLMQVLPFRRVVAFNRFSRIFPMCSFNKMNGEIDLTMQSAKDAPNVGDGYLVHGT
jgi:hypothetical protein